MEAKDYTLDEIQKNLILLEGHIRHFPIDAKEEKGSLFCKDCIQKHLYAIEGLSEEGVKFFPDRMSEFQDLGAWAQDLRLTLKNFSVNEVEPTINEIDKYRKQFLPEGKCYKCEMLNLQEVDEGHIR